MIDSQRGPWDQIGFSHLISNKCERNNCLIQTPQSIDKSSQLYFVRANGTPVLQCKKSLLVELAFMRADGIMAKPMKTLLLHYPMLQFLVTRNITLYLRN